VKIRIDEDKCCGYAACLSVAPTVFDLAPDNIALVLIAEPTADLHGEVREAAAACPTDAIVIDE
jgi:ferredoxin